MKTLMDIVDRTPSPSPWTEGDNIPWNDPEFSERMLVEHLSQEHDLESRKAESIDEHVDWIVSTVLEGRPRKVLMGGTLYCTIAKGDPTCVFEFYRKGTAPDNAHLNKYVQRGASTDSFEYLPA